MWDVLDVDSSSEWPNTNVQNGGLTCWTELQIILLDNTLAMPPTDEKRGHTSAKVQSTSGKVITSNPRPDPCSEVKIVQHKG
jgi:hypothetical protein